MSTNAERDSSTDRLLKAALRPGDVPAGPACLDPERLAAWADGQIYGQDATDIEAHLADCARCQAMLAAFVRAEPAADMTAPVAAPAVVPFRPRRTLWWFVPAAGTIAATLLVWTAVRRPANVTPPAQSMAKVEAPPEPALPAAPKKDVAAATRPGDKSARDAKPKPAPAAPPTASPAASPVSASPVAAPLPVPPPPASAAAAAGATAEVRVTAARPELVRASTPPVAPTASANLIQTLPRSDRSALSSLVTLPGGVIEFGPPQDLANAPVAQGGAAGAGGGRGGGGGARGVAQKASPAESRGSIRWRIAPTGEVTRTNDAGNTWARVTLDPPAPVTSGAAPSASVCWLVGRGGLVLLSTDGARFTRITFPEAADLRSVTAVDARQATVTTVAGRVFTTTDGGATWRPQDSLPRPF